MESAVISNQEIAAGGDSLCAVLFSSHSHNSISAVIR